MRRAATSNRTLMAATLNTVQPAPTTTPTMASSLAAPAAGKPHKTASSCSSIASTLFGGLKHHAAPAATAGATAVSSRKSSTKEKRWRQREDERVEKLRLLVSYLRNGSSQQMLVKPVKLEADEIELAQRYKSMPALCDNCLKSAELQQPIAMDPMPIGGGFQPAGSVSSCSIMNLSGACGGGSAVNADGSSSCGLYHNHHSGCGSNYSSCSRTPEIGWNQSMSGCSSHKQLNASQSSVGIVINVRRSSEQSECPASASDTDSHHNQQLTSTSAESDQISGSTYSGISGCGKSCGGSTTNLQHAASTNLNASMDSGAILHNCSSGGLASSTPLSTVASSNGPNYNNSNNQPTGTIATAASATATTPPPPPPPSSKMFYIGDHERRDGCTWTNPPNLASWIDNEVNSLVNDLEAKSQLAKSEKSMKSSKRKWLPSASSSSSSSSAGANRRSSSGAHST